MVIARYTTNTGKRRPVEYTEDEEYHRQHANMPPSRLDMDGVEGMGMGLNMGLSIGQDSNDDSTSRSSSGPATKTNTTPAPPRKVVQNQSDDEDESNDDSDDSSDSDMSRGAKKAKAKTATGVGSKGGVTPARTISASGAVSSPGTAKKPTVEVSLKVYAYADYNV